MKNAIHRVLALHPGARQPADFIACVDPANSGEELVSFWNTTTLGARDDAALAAVETVKPKLFAAAENKWLEIIENGTVTIGGFQSSTAERWQGYISRAVQLSASSPSTPILWNGVTPITPTQLAALGTAVGEFVQAAFATLGTVEASIAAGSITTTVQIDAAAWPPNT